MGLRLTILAASAVLLPAAAGAQAAQQDQQPAADAAAQPAANAPADANAQAGANAQTDAKAQDDAAGGGAAKAATAADIKAGATVFDSKGNEVGKIESVDSKGATLDTGKVKVTVPLKGFARNDKGLVFGMTKAEVEAAAEKSSNE